MVAWPSGRGTGLLEDTVANARHGHPAWVVLWGRPVRFWHIVGLRCYSRFQWHRGLGGDAPHHSFCQRLALFFAIPFGLYRRITGPRLACLSFAGMWVVSEWLRTWLLTGFPWLLLGTSQIDSPLAPWAPVGGVYLLSLMTALTGTLGVEVLRRRWSFLVPMAALWIVPFLLPAQWTTPAGKPIRVALLQGILTSALSGLPKGSAKRSVSTRR